MLRAKKAANVSSISSPGDQLVGFGKFATMTRGGLYHRQAREHQSYVRSYVMKHVVTHRGSLMEKMQDYVRERDHAASTTPRRKSQTVTASTTTRKRRRGAAEEVFDLDLVRHMDEVMLQLDQRTGEFVNLNILAILMKLSSDETDYKFLTKVIHVTMSIIIL